MGWRRYLPSDYFWLLKTALERPIFNQMNPNSMAVTGIEGTPETLMIIA